eukprot:scaffold18380_cov30-Tisochrysis_lutea.AAC.1
MASSALPAALSALALLYAACASRGLSLSTAPKASAAAMCSPILAHAFPWLKSDSASVGTICTALPKALAASAWRCIW